MSLLTPYVSPTFHSLVFTRPDVIDVYWCKSCLHGLTMRSPGSWLGGSRVSALRLFCFSTTRPILVILVGSWTVYWSTLFFDFPMRELYRLCTIRSMAQTVLRPGKSREGEGREKKLVILVGLFCLFVMDCENTRAAWQLFFTART